MRIIHTSDVHLDSPLTARLSVDRIRERKEELISSFRRSIERAIDLGASGYLIAGDLFDTERVSRSTLENLMAIVGAASELTFYYLFGNHEKRLLTDSGISLPANLRIFDEDWTYFRLDDVVIAGRATTSEDMFRTLKLDPDRKNIVVLHGELCDHSAEGGAIGVGELEGLPIDYLALGHYHTYSERKIGTRCTAVYSGTPEGRGFDEVGEKGVVLLDIDRYGLRHELVRCSKRTLHAIDADISAARTSLDVEAAIENATRGIPNTDLVRVSLVGERPVELSYHLATLQDRVGLKFYHFEVRDESRLKINASDFANDRSLKGEFIRSVAASDIPPELRDKVITVGLRALMGEELDI